MDFKFKSFSFRRVSESSAQNMWKSTSKNIFETYGHLGKHFYNNIEIVQLLKPQEVSKSVFRLRKIHDTKQSTQNCLIDTRARTKSIKISDFISRKRKSADKTEFRIKDWFEHYISQKRSKNEAIVKTQNINIVHDNKQTILKNNTKLFFNPKNIKNHASLNHLLRKPDFNKRTSILIKPKVNAFPNNLSNSSKIDLVIDLLKNILNDSIMKSIYVKDFIVLYYKFYKYPNYQFNYRSKSINLENDVISAKKNTMLKSATFKEYLLNLFKHYDAMKEPGMKPIEINHIFKEISNYTDESRQKDTHSEQNNIPDTNYRRVRFNFLSFRKDIKGFIHSLKRYNKTAALKVIQIKPLHNRKEIKENHNIQNYNRQSFNHTKSIENLASKSKASVPVAARKTTNLLKGIIISALEKNSKIGLKDKKDNKLVKIVKKNMLIQRIFTKKQPEILSNKNSFIAKDNYIYKGMSVKADVGLLYRLPKTLHTNKLIVNSKPNEKFKLTKQMSFEPGLSFHRRRYSDNVTRTIIR